MKNLKMISNQAKEQFYKTGNIEFFMMYKNINKLIKNIQLVAEIEIESSQEPELQL